MALFVLGVTYSGVNPERNGEKQNQQREEEVRKRQDIHKPGQMSEGYEHHDNKEQQDITPDDSDLQFDPIDDELEEDDLMLEGYPVK